MKIFKQTLIILVVTLISCNNKIEFIELPYHSDTNDMYFNYIVKNPPKDIDSLNKNLINFYIKKQKDFYAKDTTYSSHIKCIWFYEKNSSTSYFIKSPDDSGGWSSEVLRDYYNGATFPQSGLASIGFLRCGRDTTKYIYMLINMRVDEIDKRRAILRDDCTTNWYENNRHNELVYLFNEHMPF